MKLVNGYQSLIWEVPLTSQLGYAYVQTINPNELGHVSPSFLVKILDYRSDLPIKKFDPAFFGQLDLLTSHLLAMGTPPQRTGDIRWKPLGYLPLTAFDYVLPESKGYIHESDEPFSYEVVSQDATWRVFWGGALSDYYPAYATYEQVKHLGWLTHFNIAFLHHRITMEWMRKLGLAYQEYQTNQWDAEFLMTQKYQIKTTVLFSAVPPAIRGKAIETFL
ncbi:hypothetical protein CLV58_13038 [Spirosoma oryzae]|uniref:Uncharacterized protein n=1 Tax=Spirosoma oryzae TaxID=1469603 RepID=A0A2T0S408_9BACT|nr:hypothetical protein [Spirosoma oryzae]PRY28181.1 hypothetical protein CLV58_13038 [Spirosoma oryzae]